MTTLSIPDLAYQYLRVQCGYLSHLTDRDEFERGYDEYLHELLSNILPHIPDHAVRTLDIGGGMSGIGLMLKAFYGWDLDHYVVDGLLDDPVVDTHDRTFSNVTALAEFYGTNGGLPVTGWSVHAQKFAGPFDLVTSFASWCFHYPPEEYLDRVQAAVGPGSVIILDVRRDRPWYGQLCRAFGEGKVIHTLPKLERCVWRLI